MKIGVLTSLFPSAERPREGIFALRRWVGMAARGHEVHVVQPTPRVPWPLGALAPRRFGDLAARPASEVLEGLPVERPRYLHISGRTLPNARRFARAGVTALLAHEPEVVVCDYAWPASAAAEQLRKAGTACVVSGRGSDVLEVSGEAGFGAELGTNLRTAGAWCAVSQDLVAAMDRLAGERRGVLVPNGVDSALFGIVDAESRSALRADLGWQPDEGIVLLVGHLIERKDPTLALAAFASLCATRPGVRLVVVGAGPLEKTLRADIDRRRLGERVELLGERDPEALAKLYAAADVLLLTSKREGRPNVVLEAFSSGLPVVATDAGGTAELFAPGPMDVVESRYPSDLGAALAAALETPPERSALAASVAALSWDAGLARLETLLMEAPR